MTETIEIWATKYALTIGIIHSFAEHQPKYDMVVVRRTSMFRVDFYFHKEGRDWHRSLDAALARAEQMRRDRIASLQRSIRRIEGMKINVVKRGRHKKSGPARGQRSPIERGP